MPYDLVVSAFTLLELPSLENRIKTILNLWDRTKKYLVIVENGTNAGFKVRETLVHVIKFKRIRATLFQLLLFL